MDHPNLFSCTDLLTIIFVLFCYLCFIQFMQIKPLQNWLIEHFSKMPMIYSRKLITSNISSPTAEPDLRTLP